MKFSLRSLLVATAVVAVSISSFVVDGATGVVGFAAGVFFAWLVVSVCRGMSLTVGTGCFACASVLTMLAIPVLAMLVSARVMDWGVFLAGDLVGIGWALGLVDFFRRRGRGVWILGAFHLGATLAAAALLGWALYELSRPLPLPRGNTDDRPFILGLVRHLRVVLAYGAVLWTGAQLVLLARIRAARVRGDTAATQEQPVPDEVHYEFPKRRFHE